MTRTAVITGGASGLGEACARRFAAEGARVWILDANAARAAEVAADIGGGARSAGIDVTDEAALLAIAERIEADTGAPDILVTSAGILETVATVMDEDMAIHDRVWAVNYRGTVLSCRAFGRQMRAAGRGAIVTIGSVNSFSALPLP
ncbi:MAG: SDR family oxidoreductase, partial [Rhodobacteraceae bacterium]|nr:SDR family oxidoreductase [Paracoccaceae bacterium]